MSRPTALVSCGHCKKDFLKPRHHYKANLKLGHNFYCSKNCQTENSKLGKIISCENPVCQNQFYRTPKDILGHNYCSSSCAAIVNNQKYPKWTQRYCAVCKKEFKNRDSKYCSRGCGWSAMTKSRLPKYDPQEIKNLIQKLAKNLNRSPSRRELGNISDAAIRAFGSWNAALNLAGLAPNRSQDNRMYKRTRTKAVDGHLCDSASEAIIDNWLTRNNIPHTRNAHYPDTKHLADWALDQKIFIEYFGLAKDSPRYDREIRKKKKLCKTSGIKLIAIYPKDLYPKNNLDNILYKI